MTNFWIIEGGIWELLQDGNPERRWLATIDADQCDEWLMADEWERLAAALASGDTGTAHELVMLSYIVEEEDTRESDNE